MRIVKFKNRAKEKMAGLCWLMMVMSLLVCRGANAGWWPFSSDENEETHPPPPPAIEESKRPIKFELNSAEQKFLAQAQEVMNIPPLEACQHRVVKELRESCEGMREEELGKMSVALLNCQSQAENRPTFPCTSHMTLAECTKNMDATVWNAYHIISNRARSVCYATRQQMFRRQTEAVVNHLSSSSLQQIQAMSELSEQQSEVRQLAQSSLDTLQKTKEEAEERERELAEKQEGMKEKIAMNLEHLAREKVLISSGQQMIANMTDDIRKQLEVASDMLGSQETNMKQSQKEILDDISTVRENIQGVWGKIDNRTEQLLDVLQDITDHYQDTLESLKVINETLTGVQEMVEGMRTAVHSQLDWVVGQLGGANHGLRVLTSCVCHSLFLLVAMLVVVFLRVPAPARLFLLVAVVTNALCDVRMNVALTYTALTGMATIIMLLNWIYIAIRRKPTAPPPPPPQPIISLPSSQPHVIQSQPADHAYFPPDHTHFNQSIVTVSEEDESIDVEYDVESKPVRNGRASRDLTPQFMAAETLCSTPSKSSSSSVHITPASRPTRCVAMTTNGMQCRCRPVLGSVTCRRHN